MKPATMETVVGYMKVASRVVGWQKVCEMMLGWADDAMHFEMMRQLMEECGPRWTEAFIKEESAEKEGNPFDAA